MAIKILTKNPCTSQWTQASLYTAKSLGHGPYQAKLLRNWTREFVLNHEFIPEHSWKGGLGRSYLDDEDFTQKINLYLQGLGEWIRAQDIVNYVSHPDVLERLGRQKPISLATAQRWLARMGYRWTKTPKGQYSDSHEHIDVVEPSMRKWNNDSTQEVEENLLPHRKVLWYHDESTYYAHDRCRVRWVHKTEKAVPLAKGEGHSLMVAAFVSADYGWICLQLFQAGKARDGYFDNNDVRAQFKRAMEYVREHYPDDNHEFGALSASKMPKGPSPTFGVDINVMGPNGKPVYDTDGKIKKERACMANGKFADGHEQDFYFPEGHDHAGQFKGMAAIIEERGFSDIAKKKAQCGKSFSNCPEGATDCCCHWFLYNQPDFMHVESLLKQDAKAMGFRVIFLPKFHCELNFIEQCWGYAKQCYRMYPPSSKEEDLEQNLLQSLEEVPLIAIFATCSLRFMDAYRKGLDSAEAAWAAKKYHGHRTIPENILSQIGTLMNAPRCR
ncbi:hypothetical protein BDN71DRAFT_1483126 [Pleurotus eryngii]|uniref:Uncharacterized protein n=1 Tax=Pleurotus eryngii TaxID=5323 RepID=A0A9P5ZW62_PLEER|nr:hypothetical protein BDN71DRAFT_1483126 [Pleurotus eryngii]